MAAVASAYTAPGVGQFLTAEYPAARQRAQAGITLSPMSGAVMVAATQQGAGSGGVGEDPFGS